MLCGRVWRTCGKDVCEEDEVGFVFGSSWQFQGVEVCVWYADVLCLAWGISVGCPYSLQVQDHLPPR